MCLYSLKSHLKTSVFQLHVSFTLSYREKVDSMYSETQKESLDITKPLYSTAALYTACKLVEYYDVIYKHSTLSSCHTNLGSPLIRTHWTDDTSIYCIAGGELYLVDWRFSCHTANIKSVNIAPTPGEGVAIVP